MGEQRTPEQVAREMFQFGTVRDVRLRKKMANAIRSAVNERLEMAAAKMLDEVEDLSCWQAAELVRSLKLPEPQP